MNDLIERQAAIDAIFSEPLYEPGMKKRYADAVVPAIYEKIKSLPSAQPDVPDTNVGDLISRQAAIDAPEKFIKDCNPEHFVGHQKFIEFMDDAEIGSFGNWQFANGFNMGLTAAEVAIKNLPSAQSEIIRCKECKHNANPPEAGNADCDLFYGMTEQYGFCHRAERRTDG